MKKISAMFGLLCLAAVSARSGTALDEIMKTAGVETLPTVSLAPMQVKAAAEAPAAGEEIPYVGYDGNQGIESGRLHFDGRTVLAFTNDLPNGDIGVHLAGGNRVTLNIGNGHVPFELGTVELPQDTQYSRMVKLNLRPGVKIEKSVETGIPRPKLDGNGGIYLGRPRYESFKIRFPEGEVVLVKQEGLEAKTKKGWENQGTAVWKSTSVSKPCPPADQRTGS